MKSKGWAISSCPKLAKLLALSLASILLMSVFGFTSGFSYRAFAAQKTDTVTGKITMTLDNSSTPSQPRGGTGTETGGGSETDKTGGGTGTDGRSGSATSGTDKQTSGGEQGATDNKTANNQAPASDQGSFNKILASTGDLLPFLAIIVFVVGSMSLGISYIARKRACANVSGNHQVSITSKRKKTLIVLAASLFILVSASVAKQAIAGDADAGRTAGSEIARVKGSIVVDNKGEIKSANLDLLNVCKSNLTLGKIAGTGDLAKLIDEKLLEGNVVKPIDSINKNWSPKDDKINPLLLDKLVKNSGKLVEDVTVDVTRNVYTVKYLMGKNDPTVIDEQTIYENEMASYPSDNPKKLNHYFEYFYTDTPNGRDMVDQYYAATHPIKQDIEYYALWKYYHPSDSFMLRKNADPNHVVEFSKKTTKDEEFIPIEKVKEAADLIKKGINPNPEVFNDQNDEWHMFTRTTETPNDANQWIESRIIHVGDHDGDRTGLTFQAVHGSLGIMSYSDTYEPGKSNPDLNDYTSSNLRRWINDYNVGTGFEKLRDIVKAVRKSTVCGLTFKSKSLLDEHTDRFWVAGFTEMVSNADQKSKYWKDPKCEGTTYNFWRTKNIIPRVDGKDESVSPEQARLFKELTLNRADLATGKQSGAPRSVWMRSISPDAPDKALRIHANGQIDSNGGDEIRESNAYVLCFAI